jgi:hypothetical protein
MTGLLVLGAGVTLLGLVLLFCSATALWRRSLLLATAALLLIGLAAATSLGNEWASVLLPLLAVAGLGLASLVFRSPFPRRLLDTTLRLAGRPHVQAVALIALGLLLLVGVPWLSEREAERALGLTGGYADDPTTALIHQNKRTAFTDRGARLDVFDLGVHVPLRDEAAAEAHLASTGDMGLHLIRTAAPDGRSNCHGWVFTGGRYFMDGGDVDRILEDNGYDVFQTPQAGDLVVYRVGRGIASHTAVVRVATGDGLILLESKWNTLGCYLHAPEDFHLPGATWTYYRSARSGHILRGLDADGASPGEFTVTAAP